MLQSDASGNLSWIDKPSSGINSCAVSSPSIIGSFATNNSLNVYMYQHIWTGGEYTPKKAKLYAPSSSIITGKVGLAIYKGELRDPGSAVIISGFYLQVLTAEIGFKIIELQDLGNGALTAGDNVVFVFFMSGTGSSGETYGVVPMSNSIDLCALSTGYSAWPSSGSFPTLNDIINAGALTGPRVGPWLEFFK